MSTVSPQASRELADRVRALGAQMLDAPVSGSIPQAEHGTLAIMVGGDRHAFGEWSRCCASSAAGHPRRRQRPRRCCSSSPSTSASPSQTLAFSEGLLLAERGGIDPRLAAR